MLNRSASLAMSTSILKALPGKPDIKRHSPSILYVYVHRTRGLFTDWKIASTLFFNIPPPTHFTSMHLAHLSFKQSMP